MPFFWGREKDMTLQACLSLWRYDKWITALLRKVKCYTINNLTLFRVMEYYTTGRVWWGSSPCKQCILTFPVLSSSTCLNCWAHWMWWPSHCVPCYCSKGSWTLSTLRIDLFHDPCCTSSTPEWSCIPDAWEWMWSSSPTAELAWWHGSSSSLPSIWLVCSVMASVLPL